MSRDADVVTLVGLLKMEAPAGDVLLCDGGFVDFDSGDGVERYEEWDDVFGVIHKLGKLEAQFGNLAEGGELSFAPNQEAVVTDWFRADLENTRIRIWTGEVDADGKTVSTAKMVADRLVDTVGRDQNPKGEDLLVLQLMGRAQKFFLTNEGIVCSERSHKSFYPGEDGFNNCIDTGVEVAWGIPSTVNGTTNVSGGSGTGTDRLVTDFR